MSEGEIKRVIAVAARNVAVALVNHNELCVVSCARVPGSHKAMDVLELIETVVKEQLAGSLIIGPGGDGSEDDLEQLRRER